jgi:hypothetical protein
MNSSMYWVLILFGDFFLVFVPAVVILVSNKATGKTKAKWLSYWLASVTIVPLILISIMGAITGIVFGRNREDLIFLEAMSVGVLGLFFGWGVLYLFYKVMKKQESQMVI